MDTIEALKAILFIDDGTQPLTWQHFKDFCNSLSEDQLNQQVVYIGEETGGCINTIGECQDDMIDPSGEGLTPVSFMKEEDPEEDWDQEKILMPKGHLFLDLQK